VNVSPDEVRDYWESRSPGLKHSQEDVGSPAFFAAVEHERYSDIFKYAYLKDIVGFDQHSGEKVLEIGVGLGTDILQFARAGSDVHGIDLTARAVELTNQRFEQEGLTGHFQQASFTALPFEGNTFDVVYSFGVLHHSTETEQGIAEVLRVLKPGGQLIVMLYHKGFKYYVRKLFLYGVLKGEFLKRSPQEIVNRHSEDFGSSPLTKVYSRGQARKMFAEFEQLALDCYRLDDYVPFRGRPFSLARTILPPRLYRAVENAAGWNLIIRGTKPAASQPLFPAKRSSNGLGAITTTRTYGYTRSVAVYPVGSRGSSSI